MKSLSCLHRYWVIICPMHKAEAVSCLAACAVNFVGGGGREESPVSLSWLAGSEESQMKQASPNGMNIVGSPVPMTKKSPVASSARHGTPYTINYTIA